MCPQTHGRTPCTCARRCNTRRHTQQRPRASRPPRLLSGNTPCCRQCALLCRWHTAPRPDTTRSPGHTRTRLGADSVPVGTLHDAVPDGKPRAIGERRNARRAAQQRVVAAQDVRLRVDAPPRTTARLARNKGAEVLLVALGAGPFTCAAPCSIVSARVTRHPSPYATASSHVTHVTLSPATRSAVCQPGDRDMCTPPADKRDGPLGHASVPAAHHNPAPVPNNNGVRPVVHGERKRRTGRPNNAPDAPVKVDACRCDADGCVGAATDKRLAGRADDRVLPSSTTAPRSITVPRVPLFLFGWFTTIKQRIN